MLKIKDNVDLKELEKFGFGKYEFDYIFGVCNDAIYIDIMNRSLEVCISADYCIEDLLYDLIQAGLVEKV